MHVQVVEDKPEGDEDVGRKQATSWTVERSVRVPTL